MDYVLACCQFALSIVLLFAGFGKIVGARDFIGTLQKSGFSRGFSFITAFGIVALEFVFAIMLPFNIMLNFVFIGTFALLASFTIWLVNVYRKKLNMTCNCFGSQAGQVGKKVVSLEIVF